MFLETGFLEFVDHTGGLTACSTLDTTRLAGKSRAVSILKPPDLGSRSVSLIVPRGNSENNGRFGGCVYVGSCQAAVRYYALRARAAEHADKGQLTWTAGYSLCVTLSRGGG